MYSDKNEVEKVNFGDLPIDWEDEEFADEIYDEQQVDFYKEKMKKGNRKLNKSKHITEE
ncbi:hypothetical protein J40TS1_09810 [Paenibacillus montaniterrae]|uniref:Uncharacterized protein n=1 Tax=Paenibacillus montaniterrae TaxID=429341 RepID=A0A920CXR6_9BACL|nr:hypothetical protein [Paenibacillus montaniterrae]GIP15339.1 hypothetical protein J40TS1_09810 [Paenibacillus montaniterrae]